MDLQADGQQLQGGLAVAHSLCAMGMRRISASRRVAGDAAPALPNPWSWQYAGSPGSAARRKELGHSLQTRRGWHGRDGCTGLLIQHWPKVPGGLLCSHPALEAGSDVLCWLGVGNLLCALVWEKMRRKPDLLRDGGCHRKLHLQAAKNVEKGLFPPPLSFICSQYPSKV